MKQPGVLLGIALYFCCAVLGVGYLLWSAWNEPQPAVAPLPLEQAVLPVQPAEGDSPAPEIAADAAGGPGDSTLGSIRGRVFLDGPPEPAPGANVAAILDLARSYAMAATAGADGGYLLADLAPGRYRVTAWSGEWAMEPLGPEEEVVEVRAGRSTDDVDRTLIPGGVVTGKVLEEGTREPIAGAAVEGEGMRLAITDDDGSFQLAGVRRGLRSVSASAPGFTSKRALAEVTAGELPFVVLELAPGGVIEGLVTNVAGQPAAGATVWTTVNPTAARTEADPEGRYRLEGVPLEARDIAVFAALDGQLETQESVKEFPEGEVSIHLDLQLEAGLTFSGRVADAEGRPIAGAALYISSSGEKPTAVTGDEGLFTIEGAPKKMFMLTAQKKGYAPTSLDLNDLKSNAERESIELVLEPGHFVEGKVVDTAGRLLHRAWVGVDALGFDSGPFPWTYTGRDGRFRLDGLPPTFGGLAAAKAGYCESRGNQIEADRTDVVLVLEEARIEGIVVEKASGKPIPEFTVTFGWTEFQAQGGRFRITADIVLNESYKLIVVAEGHAEAIVDGVKAWPASEAREPLRIELEQGGVLHGSIVSTATRAPLEGVRITHVTEETKSREQQWFGQLSTHGRVLRKATSDAMGEFTIAGLSDRPGVLLLDRKGFARTVIPGVKPGGIAQTFELAPGAAVEGTTRDLAGEPAAGMLVRAYAGGQSFPGTLTGRDGMYRLEDLPEGEATVSFDMPAPAGHAIRRQVGVRLRAGETAHADLVVATGSIAGTVTRRGVPIREAIVFVSRSANEGIGFPTDAKGRFQAVALPPGPYEVRVESMGQGDSYCNVGFGRKVEVGGGETRCDIDLAATLISGRVVWGQTREPVSGAHVALFNKGGRLCAEAICAPDGNRFELEAPGSGSYWLSVSASRGEKPGGWLGPIAVAEGMGLRELEVPMGGTGSISVLVSDAATRQPLAGARIVLRDWEGIVFGAEAETDVSGQARLEDLSAGEYRLEVTTDDHLPRAVDLEVGTTDIEKTFELERRQPRLSDPAEDDDAR